MQEAVNIRHQRIKLLALIAVFALPVLTAWVMVQWRIGIPEQRTAHGQLAPEIPRLAEWPLAESFGTVDGGDWILAFDCTSDCAQEADRWWRLHRALGREAPRVTRLRIGGEGDVLPGEVGNHWRNVPDWQSPGRVWLLDPQGKVVLTYEREVAERDVMDDLSHLLRMNPDPRAAPELDGTHR
ncbi:hypothetical protein EKK97_12500 [Billgrantia tianxiuensis]|uniref:Thioredoxin domain-containing protein n=1 Tax=Billgrantia tianxiuensis TaxID=2497861 RepID=A0A6I6SP66_9GAMM|nr:hypothetical protein [Halomonas tianxiuensis]MCE8031611.1 hypothetical protein [Halomonas sp. MCCC 1A11057]QHC50244.1 hypothetical protein EKK97_12500 [Halomonas tianxiuensis]